MNVDSTYENLEQVVGLIMEGKPVSMDDLHKSLAQVATCILESYENSRGLVQRILWLLEKCPDDAISIFLHDVITFIENIDLYYSAEQEGSSDIYERFSAPWTEDDIKAIYEKAMPLFDNEHILSYSNDRIATSLSIKERKQFVDYAISCIQEYGQQSHWTKEIIDLQITHFSLLYSICHHDSLMDLCFHFADNMIDRISLSDSPQLTRDIAESILLIGYEEKMQSHAYLCASRAYTACRNALAGLFYLYIAIVSIQQTNRKLSRDEVYDILWLVIKILRVLPGYSDKLTNVVIEKFRDLHYEDKKVLWFMHTVFTLKLMRKQVQVVSEVFDFLNEYREPIIKNIKHGAGPWFTLLCEIERYYPTLFNNQLKLYKDFFSNNLETNGNERLKDVLSGENLSQHLFETIKQLEQTRNNSDYAIDNKSAVVIANRLLPQAVEMANIGDFILSMRVKTDFTFIFKDTYQKAMYKKMELNDYKPGNYDTPYRHIDKLPDFLTIEQNDSMLWIGESNGRFYFISLKGKDYSIEELNTWKDLNVYELNRVVSGIQFIKETTDRTGCYYPKSEQDFEEEDKSIGEHYGHHILSVPTDTKRLLIVKDVEISSLPHHLFATSEDDYIGYRMPSANVISTEFLIHSNFENNIRLDNVSNFWIPIDSGDIALNQLWSHLENEISPFCANIFTTTLMDKPLNGDINVVCAHGAKTIGETDWLFANEQPIKDAEAIVGNGKLLILLVCHAGSMKAGVYDTAVHTIIKKFIRNGYVSVVAPAWSLSTEIVPLWMKTFMTEFVNNKAYVVDAVYKANMAVKEEYNTISAWACMHIYGNPYLQINEVPSLSINMK